MNGYTSGGEGDNIDWDTEDELEIKKSPSACSNPALGEAIAGSIEASSSAGSSSAKMIDHFVGMGFSEEIVFKTIQENGEGNADSILETLLKYSMSSPEGSSNSKLVDHFIAMGFSKDMVVKAIEENGEDNTDSILETLLTYSAIGKSPPVQQNCDSDHSSSDCKGSFLDDFSDIESCSAGEEITNPASDEDKKLLSLANMGYKVEEVKIAMERCE